MELRGYWAILRRRWAAPVLVPVLVALFSAVQLQPWQEPAPSYSVTMRMLIGVLPLEDPDAARYYDPRYYAWMTSEYLVDDFTEVLGTEMFANAISARLTEQGLSIPAGLIRAQANTGKQHRIIRLTFMWHDEAALQAIADATVAELEQNADAYFTQLGTQDAGVRVLDSPVVVPQGQSARARVEWPLRILLAVVAGIGVAFLREYMDDTVRRREELEEMGLTVLVAVPRPGGFGNILNASTRTSRRSASE
jgi:capsular polysaccharide biosynthesis protein